MVLHIVVWNLLLLYPYAPIACYGGIRVGVFSSQAVFVYRPTQPYSALPLSVHRNSLTAVGANGIVCFIAFLSHCQSYRLSHKW